MLITGNNHQMTHENFKFMFETGNFSIILRLLWHVIFLPVWTQFLYATLFCPKTYFGYILLPCFVLNILTALYKRKQHYVTTSRATASKPLPSHPVVSALWCGDHELSPPTKASVQVFSWKSPVGFLKCVGSYLMASQRRMC